MPESGWSDVRSQWYHAALVVVWSIWALLLAFGILSALMQEQFGNTDKVKEMSELMRKVSLREYLTVRDQPYKDYRTAEEAILDRARREGDTWKGVAEEARPKG